MDRDRACLECLILRVRNGMNPNTRDLFPLVEDPTMVLPETKSATTFGPLKGATMNVHTSQPSQGEDDREPPRNRRQKLTKRPTINPVQASVSEEQSTENYDAEPYLLLQPETRHISHEQLVEEVKGIYAGLVMVDAKCIDTDDGQAKEAEEQVKLASEEWQALIALHKTLLHEHHDFFLASQHPSASPALSRLATKYSMPARMWRHGIHSFLELLRHRLPNSLDHMLSFIYMAYSMMALLYETVPTFEDTWIECLGDLGRYRMAIEDDDVQDREIWSGVAKSWYDNAANSTPSKGRLYHHLAVLAKTRTLNQLSLYTRSLSCTIPFESARSSILTLFEPISKTEEIASRSANEESFTSDRNDCRYSPETSRIHHQPSSKSHTSMLPSNTSFLFHIQEIQGDFSLGPVANKQQRMPRISQHTMASQISHLSKRVMKKVSRVETKVRSRLRRGLASFVNGARLSVFADTGAATNVVSAAYARRRNMAIDTSSSSFKMGNSNVVDSLGTVTIDYAFAEEPAKTFNIVCHVLPHCICDLILGNPFLKATETMSKYRRRLTECLFYSAANVFHFGYMGNDQSFLEGCLADQYAVCAVPDTGAEKNVMDLQYVNYSPFKRGYFSYFCANYVLRGGLP